MNLSILISLWICIGCVSSLPSVSNLQSCTVSDFMLNYFKCHKHETPSVPAPAKANKNIYILYDINPAEGFNLRRDVYIRLAVFIERLRSVSGYEHTKLVLPPFRRLYHWRTPDVEQNLIFWNHFFDLKSMKLFTAVLDIWEFFDEYKRNYNTKTIKLDHIFRLQHYENMFENGKFVDKFEIDRCRGNNRWNTHPFGYTNMTHKHFDCMNFQGSASLLKNILDKYRITGNGPTLIMFLNAETILHDHWGDDNFWRARRSMRFSNHLRRIADEFRQEKFNSNDEADEVQRPRSWLDEKKYRKAEGGDYLCAHLRRADFLNGRENTTPTLRSAAGQIKQLVKQNRIAKVFISSDCSKQEFKDLKSFMMRTRVFRYTPESLEQHEELKDGGIAIIDQIICSHASHFIGTFESTFTYRIYEEREILGFPKKTTFNTFCKYEDKRDCEKNSVWPIIY